MDTIDLEGLDKAAVLAALYNASKPQGMGFLHYDPEPMTVEEARALLSQDTDFDYLKGRVMKVDLSGDQLDPWGFDRDNGQGRAAEVIESLRMTQEPDNALIRARHASATQASAKEIRKHLSDETTVSNEEGGFCKISLGFSDVAEALGPRVEEAEASIKSPLDDVQVASQTSLFGTSQPTIDELVDLRDFFPNSCDFYWGGSGYVPEVSIILFREYRSNPPEVCSGCTNPDCKVRQISYHGHVKPQEQ